jgi:hypothetical protein
MVGRPAAAAGGGGGGGGLILRDRQGQGACWENAAYKQSTCDVLCLYVGFFLRIGLMCGAEDARKIVIFVRVFSTRDASPTSQFSKMSQPPTLVAQPDWDRVRDAELFQ